MSDLLLCLFVVLGGALGCLFELLPYFLCRLERGGSGLAGSLLGLLCGFAGLFGFIEGFFGYLCGFTYGLLCFRDAGLCLIQGGLHRVGPGLFLGGCREHHVGTDAGDSQQEGEEQSHLDELLDQPEQHDGSGAMAYGRKGRIPGSVNVPAASLCDPDTAAYLPASELRNKFDAVDVADAERIIAYCGGGISATSDAFILTMLGYDNVSVYDASMYEWSNDDSLPMETG